MQTSACQLTDFVLDERHIVERDVAEREKKAEHTQQELNTQKVLHYNIYAALYSIGKQDVLIANIKRTCNIEMKKSE